MHSFRRQLWIGLLWAMMPITFVTGAPQVGCRCANGRYKVVCDRHSGCCGVSTPVRSNKSPSAKPPAVATCCAQHKSVAERQLPTAHRALAAPKHCTPVVSLAAVPSVAERVVAPDAIGQQQPFQLDWPCISRTWAADRHAVGRLDLPVPDLVIAHQVFLI